ncbi:MAG: hypothetical protein CMC35_09575 [Flavobacteriaceae bacterium]|nr:hypothetical protein [Flavobacteriaceae bacterium]
MNKEKISAANFFQEKEILIDKADSLYHKKDYENAKLLYLELLEKSTQEIEKGYVLKRLGDIFYANKEYSTAKNFYWNSIDNCSTNKSGADSFFNLALLYGKEKARDSALYTLKQSIESYSSFPQSYGKSNTYSKAGILFKNYGKYQLAIECLLRAYDGFKELKDLGGLAKTSNTIAAVHRTLGNTSRAKGYYLQSLSFRKQQFDTLQISFAYNNLGNLYKSESRLDSASYYYRKAIYAQRQLKNPKQLDRFYYNLGTILYRSDSLSASEKYYKLSIADRKNRNDSSQLSNPYKELAMIAIKNNNLSLAKRYIDSTDQYINYSNSVEVKLRLQEIKSIYYEAIGDYRSSLKFSREYAKQYSELFQQKQAQEIQRLQEQFESELKEKEIGVLTQETKTKENIINVQRKGLSIRNTLLIVASTLLLLFTLVYFLMRLKHKNKEKALELTRLESVFEAQELVREKISKDLHDIVTTGFDGLRLKILALPEVDKPEVVRKSIISDIEIINDEIRLISHRLSPLGSKIKDNSLTTIITDQLTEFQHYRKIFVDVKLPLPKELDKMRLVSQTNLYGIILEILNNIEKHSKANEVIVDHATTNNNVFINIHDNGVGLPDDLHKGLGLVNIEQRAHLLKGTVRWESDNNGTDTYLEFPIKPNLK